MKKLTAIAVFCFTLIGLAPSLCIAGGMFLKVEGVYGGSTDPDHYGEIEVVSWKADLFNQSGSDPALPPRSLSFVKYIDATQTNFMQSCCKGEVFAHAVLTVPSGGADSYGNFTIILTDVVFTSYTLQNAHVNGYMMGGGGASEPVPVEVLSLSYSRLGVKHNSPSSDGAIVWLSDVVTNFDGDTDVDGKDW